MLANKDFCLSQNPTGKGLKAATLHLGRSPDTRTAVLSWYMLFVCMHTFVCNLGLALGVNRDCFVSLWWPHAGAGVSFTVQLALHKEVAFLFQVEIAVRAHKAFRMPVFITCLHHCPSIWKQGKEKAPIN